MKSKRELFLSLVLLLSLVLFLPSSCSFAAEKGDVAVEAVGEAAIIGGDEARARDEAKRYAYRDALEKGIGAYVEGITEMKDFQVVRDKVFSQAKGIVKSFDVLSEAADSDGIYRIRAKCTVGMKALDGVLGPVVIDALGNPRVMVVINEKVNGKNASMFFVENEVTQSFHHAGYFIIDKDQCDSLMAKKLQVAKMAQDEQALLDLAQSFNADVLICGSAVAGVNPPLVVGGQKIYKANGQLRLKAVNAQTAELIDIQTPSSQENGVSKDAAIGKALAQASRSASKIMTHKVAYGLISGNVGGRTIHVVVQGVSYSGARELRSSLEETRGVISSYQRSYRNKKLELDVCTEGNADDLAVRLDELGLEIETVTASTIEAVQGQ